MSACLSRIVFGAGAPLTVDLEETCGRAGLQVIAAVRNRPGEVFTLHPERVVEAASLPLDLRDVPYVCGLFTPANRRTAVAEALGLGLRPAEALVDPTSVRAASTVLGEGSYVNAGCVIAGGGAIGRHVIVNRASNIGHHARIGDFASIGPGVTISGFVEIGSDVLIGAGVVIAPRIRIGDGSTVAPGSVVMHDVPARTTAMGTPLRFAPRRQGER